MSVNRYRVKLFGYTDDAKVGTIEAYDTTGLYVHERDYDTLLSNALAAAAKLRELADSHDNGSPLTSPTYTGSILRRIADALEEGETDD